jgi:hypothetical protein
VSSLASILACWPIKLLERANVTISEKLPWSPTDVQVDIPPHPEDLVLYRLDIDFWKCLRVEIKDEMCLV